MVCLATTLTVFVGNHLFEAFCQFVEGYQPFPRPISPSYLNPHDLDLPWQNATAIVYQWKEQL